MKNNIYLTSISTLLFLFCWSYNDKSEAQVGSKTTEVGSQSSVDNLFHVGTKQWSESIIDIITQASEDYQAAIAGKQIPHAKAPEVALLDGGTGMFVGNGYTLKLVNKLAVVDSISGAFYGPIIKFTHPKLKSLDFELSHVEFYSADQLKKLKGGL